ncbi:MAG: hypothetical protein MUE42_14410 [Opitutaceae bacterium]|jgi:hypothetical protein|nr:hypothetical protein [Opitutaceae bacterium]
MRAARQILGLFACLVLVSARPLAGGPYDGAAGTPGSLAVAHTDAAIAGWATGVAELVRGPAQAGMPSYGLATFGAEEFVLGPVRRETPDDVYDVVSLGDGGRVTVTFARPIADGEGWDFAVFENAFAGSFLELAFVEVSSDGVNFFRFDAYSETPTGTQVGSFAAIDPTNVRNLAGKHAGGFGTPFDLAELAGRSPLLDIGAITHVRVIDVAGAIDPALASFDALGRAVNDPWPTPFATGGFDLDGVAVRHFAAEPVDGYAAWRAARFTAGELAEAAVAGDGADPDGDGLCNLLEYALGGEPRDPADAAAITPRLRHADGRLGLAYRMAEGVTGVLWAVEWSTDLVTWDDTYASFEATQVDLTGEVVVWARRTLATEPRQFMRLRVARLLR